MSVSACPRPYASAVSQWRMPRRCASTSASFALSSSWPVQPTALPSLTFGPPWPQVPRLMAETRALVRPRRIVRMAGGCYTAKRPMRLLLARLAPHKGAVAMTLLLASVTQLLMLAEPQLLRLMIDRYVMRAALLTPRQFFTGVAALVVAAVSVLMVARVMRAVQDFSIHAVAQ